MLLAITNYSDIDRQNQAYCKYISKSLLIIITNQKSVFGYTTNEGSLPELNEVRSNHLKVKNA